MDVWIRAVELPYDDEEALAYLSALRLRITDGETVLYDGPYTRAADEGGIRLRQDALARGSQKEYRVALYCDFAYTGEPGSLRGGLGCAGDPQRDPGRHSRP